MSPRRCEPCSLYRSDGLYVRVIECQTASGFPKGTDRAPFVGYESLSHDADCLADTLSTRERIAASFLRADLPVSVFGRGVGLAVRLNRHAQLGCAFSFDAWTGRAGNWPPPCSPSIADRPRRRVAAVRAACGTTGDALATERHISQDRRHSCCHASVSSAVAEQRRFYALTANASDSCVQHQRHLPNQVALSWRASDLLGVFYVASETRPVALRAFRALRALRANATLPLFRLAVSSERGTRAKACACEAIAPQQRRTTA